MSRSDMIQRYVNDQLQPLLASVDAVRPVAITLVQATFETKQKEEFDTATATITKHLDEARVKVELLRNMVDQGEALNTHLGSIIVTFAQLTKACAVFFNDASTPEEQEAAMADVTQTIQDLHSRFAAFDGVFSQPLSIKEGATIPIQEQKIEKASSKVLRGMHNVQSRQIQTASSYLSQLGTDSFVTKEPTDWTDHDLRDFLRSWLQMDEPVVAVFGQLDGPAFLSLTRDQIFQMVPPLPLGSVSIMCLYHPQAPSLPVENPGDVAMSIAEAIEDLTNTDMSHKCSIPDGELNFMNTNELVKRADIIAGDLAHEINRFTEGFMMMKPPRPAAPDSSQEGAADGVQPTDAESVAPPPPTLEQQEDPAVAHQRYSDGRAVCNDAIAKIQQAFYDIVCITQAFAKKVEDSFLVQELLSQVNNFELVSVQFQASIASLVNATGAADDPAIILQLQATAKSFVSSLSNTLEELVRVRNELADQAERNKKIDEERKKLQAARRIRGRLTTPYVPPSIDGQPHVGGNAAQPLQYGQPQGAFAPQSFPLPGQPGFNPQTGGFSPQGGFAQPGQPGSNPQTGGFSPQGGFVQPGQPGFNPQTGGFSPQGGFAQPGQPGFNPQSGGFPPQGGSAQPGGPPGYIPQPAPQTFQPGGGSNASSAAAPLGGGFRPISTPVGGISPHQAHGVPGQRQTMMPAIQRSTSDRGTWYGVDSPFQKTKPNTQRPQSGRVRLASTRRGSGMFEPVNPPVNLPVTRTSPSMSPGQSRLSMATSQLNLRASVLMLPPEFAGNVWAEREYDASLIVFDSDGPNKDELTIRAASLNQLIMRLTSVRVLDQNFMKTFLMTYSSFTSPEDVMLKLEERYAPYQGSFMLRAGPYQLNCCCKRYFVPDGVPMADDQKRTLQLKVINFLKKWIIERARDFNESLLHCVREFTESMRAEGQAPLAQQIDSALQKLQSDAKQKNEELTNASNGLFLKMKNIGRKNESPQQFVLRVSAEKLAEHLSLVDMKIYRQIQPIELLGKAWSKSDGKKRSPNVMQLITRFNNVSSWVASCILWCEKVKDRTSMVMTHLDKINNFNSLMAISAGLNNSAVHRLKFTMDELPESYKQEWTAMQEKMSTDSNSRQYRDRLHQSTPPVMPYLGIYLTDITFIEDGNPDEIAVENQKLINFRKRELVFKVIDEIQRYQQTPYKTEVDPSMLSAIQELPFNSDDDLYALSLQREPRGTANRNTIQ